MNHTPCMVGGGADLLPCFREPQFSIQKIFPTPLAPGGFVILCDMCTSFSLFASRFPQRHDHCPTVALNLNFNSYFWLHFPALTVWASQGVAVLCMWRLPNPCIPLLSRLLQCFMSCAWRLVCRRQPILPPAAVPCVDRASGWLRVQMASADFFFNVSVLCPETLFIGESHRIWVLEWGVYCSERHSLLSDEAQLL